MKSFLTPARRADMRCAMITRAQPQLQAAVFTPASACGQGGGRQPVRWYRGFLRPFSFFSFFPSYLDLVFGGRFGALTAQRTSVPPSVHKARHTFLGGGGSFTRKQQT